MNIEHKFIALPKLVDFFKENCEQFDDIYINIDGKRSKLADCTDIYGVIISDLYGTIINGQNKLLIMASKFISEHITGVTSSNGLMVHEFMSLLLQALDPEDVSIEPIVVMYNDGSSESYASSRQISMNGIKYPNRRITKIEIQFYNDSSIFCSPKLIATTK